jgi:uncharacterized protein (DUF2249 family)
MKEIKMSTTVAELLNDYKGMKDILININPKFKKLNNPVLRRTLAKLATVKQAAIVGGMKPEELLNKLRTAVGQKPIEFNDNSLNEIKNSVPEWVKNTTPKEIINANEILNEDNNPLAVSFGILKKFKNAEVLKISSDFKPEPLIKEYKKKGYEVYSQEKNEKEFETFVKKC